MFKKQNLPAFGINISQFSQKDVYPEYFAAEMLFLKAKMTGISISKYIKQKLASL